MTFYKNQIYEAEIIDISSDGSGICKIDGYTVFVPFTVVGDRISVKLLKANKNYGYGKLERLISPSPDRTEPECGVFYKCGGCALRHISYSAQLKIKQNIVKSAFERIGKISAPVEDILASRRIDKYRNKAQYPFGTDSEGNVTAGFFAKRSHRIVPCADCALQPEAFSRILKFTVAFANERKIPAYDEKTQTGVLRNLYIRTAESTGQVMVCLVAAKERSDFVIYANELSKNFKNIAGVLLNINNKNTNVILGDEYKTLLGADCITDLLCGVPLDISPAAFYQVNREQTERLYSTAAEYACLSGSETLIDLYCGAGSIGLSMSGKIKKLIGVEIVPEAVENARKNAARAGIKNAEFICADASDAAKKLVERNEKPDVVILDPPRKGCDGECIKAVCTMSPERVVMISCNPATAARDCAEFEKRGYSVQKIRPVDMFPHTNHIECVVSIQKRNKTSDKTEN